MSASKQEIQEKAAEILHMLGMRVLTGSVTLNYHDGHLVVVSVRNDFRPKAEKERDST